MSFALPVELTFQKTKVPQVFCAAFQVALLTGTILINGCGASDSNGSAATEQLIVIGAASENDCKQAGDNDASVCFIIDGSTANMYGLIDRNINTTLDDLIASQPRINTIEMVFVPGSMDDEANLQAGRKLYAAGLNTTVLSDSLIASGGVDFFLAGNLRTVATGAKIGVHSWATEENDGSLVQGSDLPEDDPQHQPYIQYYTDINLQNPAGFYFYTLDSAPAQSIHYMSTEDIARFGIATD